MMAWMSELSCLQFRSKALWNAMISHSNQLMCHSASSEVYVYFDDESAPVVISSLRLGDDQERDSPFTNSNWFAFDDEKVVSERSIASASPIADEDGHDDAVDDVVIGEAESFNDIVASYHVWIWTQMILHQRMLLQTRVNQNL